MNELITTETIQLLQYRIQQEELSSRLYEQMSLYLNDKGYLQFAKLYKKYAEEEMKHSQWSKDYILAFGVKPELQRLDSPECDFEGLPDIINKTLEHEIEISKQCKNLAKFANDNADYLLFDLAMKYFSLLLLAIISSTYTNAQNVFMAYLKDAESKAPIIGAIAHIKKINTGAAADLNGLLEIIE